MVRSQLLTIKAHVLRNYACHPEDADTRNRDLVTWGSHEMEAIVFLYACFGVTSGFVSVS